MDPLRLANESLTEHEVTRCQDELSRLLGSGSDAVLHVAQRSEQRRALEATADIPGDDTGISDRIATALGTLASLIVSAQDLQGLVMTGGDTAKSVCRHVGVTEIDLLEEVEAGIPLCRLKHESEPLAVIKAGAFGTALSLVGTHDALKGAYHQFFSDRLLTCKSNC